MGLDVSKRFAFLLLGFFYIWLFIACESSPFYPVIPAPVTRDSGDTELAEVLNSIRLAEGLPGLAAAIIVDGKTFSTAAVGTRKIGTENWVTVDDKFLIGSCGKAFTATLVGVLVDEGSLNWHTNLKDVFPDLRMLPEYETITMAMLLSHRAGLPKNFIAKLDSNRPTTPMGGRTQFVEQIVQTPLLNPPGRVMLYSNAGYVLAGAMMEKVTAQSFETLMDENIFHPLKMDTAGYVTPAEIEPNSQPWGHVKELRSYRAIKKDHNYWLNPAGSTLSISIKDWAKFITQNMYTQQKKLKPVIRQATLKELHTPPDRLKWASDEKGLAIWHQRIGWPLTSANYALGWYVIKTDNLNDTLYHGGATNSFIADVYMSPKNKTAILLATNARIPHIPLYKSAKKIRSNYSLSLSIP